MGRCCVFQDVGVSDPLQVCCAALHPLLKLDTQPHERELLAILVCEMIGLLSLWISIFITIVLGDKRALKRCEIASEGNRASGASRKQRNSKTQALTHCILKRKKEMNRLLTLRKVLNKCDKLKARLRLMAGPISDISSLTGVQFYSRATFCCLNPTNFSTVSSLPSCPLLLTRTISAGNWTDSTLIMIC